MTISVHQRSLVVLALLAASVMAESHVAEQGDTSSAEQPPSFHDDIVPILTRYDCNSGGCHGKTAGQNGFKLSLRGYAPDLDFDSITNEGRARRISPVLPENSLFVQKATGHVPHEGGRRFSVASRPADVLVNWIRHGMPGPDDAEAVPTTLTILPSKQALAVGDQVSLKVVAGYSDGRERDVTWLARFASGNEPTLEVSQSGVVHARRSGETVVRAAFRGLVAVAEFTTPYQTKVDPSHFSARNNAVDGPVFDKLAALNIEPSGLCDDATFLRRASLDAIGTLPTLDEVRAFLADTRPDKRQRLIDSLLERHEFVDYWTYWLAELLQNRKERDHDMRGTKGVRSFHAWLRERVAANRSWRQIASDVLTASGATIDNPAVGYFIVTVGGKSSEQSEVADSVAQAFMGTRVGCARCHNHPLEKYTQDDYYHFIGFFSRVALERQKPEVGPTTLIVGTRHLLNLRKQMKQQNEKLTKLEESKGEMKEIEGVRKRIADIERQIQSHMDQPVTVRQPRTGKSLSPRPLDQSQTPVAARSDPRVVFVKWLTDPKNESFSGAMINRLWKHFLGVGLVEPVDDLRATNPPSNRALWDVLNREFVDSDFDLKHVMRLIMNSRTYQLSAATNSSNVRDQRFYSHFYARRLPAEVLLDAISSATDQPETFPGYPRGVRAIQVPDPFADSYFLTMFGRAPRTTACACERANDVTLPQLLNLQNGDELHRKLNASDGRLARLLGEETDNGALVDRIYLSTVSRLPADDERDTVLAHFRDADRKDVAFDLFWALLNSADFTFNR